MKLFKPMLPYLGIILVIFYLLPNFITNTGTVLLILYSAIPFACFICSLFYGFNNRFHWQYAVIVAVLFVPAVFIYMNHTALIYAPIYGVTALIGNALGTIFNRNKS